MRAEVLIAAVDMSPPDLSGLPPAGLYVWAWCVGAALTSFGRLAVMRLPHQFGRREPADPALTLCSPPSRCDGCGHRIRARHLVPVAGWLIARGRCPDCGMRVSPLHPLIEAAGGAGWVAALAWFGPGAQGWAACVLWQMLLFLAEIAWRESWLPAVVTVPLGVAGVLWSPFEPSVGARWLGALCGVLLMAGAMALVSRASGDAAYSRGHVALAAAAGAWLGAGRLPPFLLLAALLYVLLVRSARRRGQRRSAAGPALAAAFLVCLVLPAWF